MKTTILNTKHSEEININGLSFLVELKNATKTGKSRSEDPRANSDYIQHYNTYIAFVNNEEFCETNSIECIISELKGGAYKMFIN